MRVGAALAVLSVFSTSACVAGTVLGSGDASDGAIHDAASHDTSSDAIADARRDVSATDASPDLGATDVIARDVVDVSTPDVAPAVDVASDTAPMHVCPGATPPDCSPGPGTGMADQCHDAPSCYITNVQHAVRDVIAAHPEWFMSNDTLMCSTVLDVDSYMNAVVADLDASGLCATRDPNDPNHEIVVKHDNDFAEDFNILASSGCARYGPLIYTGYCAPAWF